MAFEITIRETSYDADARRQSEVVYQQIVKDLDIQRVILAVNNMKELTRNGNI